MASQGLCVCVWGGGRFGKSFHVQTYFVWGVGGRFGKSFHVQTSIGPELMSGTKNTTILMQIMTFIMQDVQRE